jgi:hypothetical protein
MDLIASDGFEPATHQQKSPADGRAFLLSEQFSDFDQ